jgi:glycosyltransferase involved in cell wall biosynthesis
MPPKILFVHSSDETFVKLDRELLDTSFDLQDFYVARKFPAKFIQYLSEIRKTDVLFCWFASWNSFWALLLARLMRKGSVLVIGGYDLANLPEADYGHQRGGLGKWISRFAMSLATALFTNSYYSQKEAELNAGIPSERVRVIYHGVPDPFGSLPGAPKERMTITVGKVDQPNLKRKGIEPFVRAAAHLPDVKFVVVGAWADDSIEYLRSVASPNVVFTGRVSDEELLDYYRQASVYVQASLHEGFGLSVAEAMLAGCIPITTRAGSLPEVVGDCGYYCDSPEPSDIAKAIEMALHGSVSIRERARERILSNFPMEKRRKLLEEIIWSSGLQRNQAQDS